MGRTDARERPACRQDHGEPGGPAGRSHPDLRRALGRQRSGFAAAVLSEPEHSRGRRPEVDAAGVLQGDRRQCVRAAESRGYAVEGADGTGVLPRCRWCGLLPHGVCGGDVQDAGRPGGDSADGAGANPAAGRSMGTATRERGDGGRLSEPGGSDEQRFERGGDRPGVGRDCGDLSAGGGDAGGARRAGGVGSREVRGAAGEAGRAGGG